MKIDVLNVKKVYSCFLNYYNNEGQIKYFNTSEELHMFVNEYNKKRKWKRYKIISDGELYIDIECIENSIKYEIKELDRCNKYIKKKYDYCNIFLKYNNEFHTGYLCFDLQPDDTLIYCYKINMFSGTFMLSIDWELSEENKIESDNKEDVDHVWEYDNIKKNNDKHIYFVQEDGTGAIKIGVSNNIEDRIKILQTANPYKLNILATTKGNEDLEKYLHNEFKECKLNGEWYKPTDKLLDYINSIK